MTIVNNDIATLLQQTGFLFACVLLVGIIFICKTIVSYMRSSAKLSLGSSKYVITYYNYYKLKGY